MSAANQHRHFSNQLANLLRYHETMASDAVRNDALRRALAQHVGPSSRVLDVGAGVGTWAIVAALLGAKRVVAIEIEPALIAFIHRHAQENGVADRIEIVQGNVDDAPLRGRFDVIVSELFGGDALSQRVIDSFGNIRARCLASDGVMIPQRIEMQAIPVSCSALSSTVGDGLDVSMDFLRTSLPHYPRLISVDERRRVEQLSAPSVLAFVDFRVTELAPSLTAMRAGWQLDELERADGIMVTNRHVFTDDIEMDSTGSASWGAMLYRFEPVGAGAGVLRFELTMGQSHAWSVASADHAGARPTGYGPDLNAMRWQRADQRAPRRKVRARPAPATEAPLES
jgi:FkbM family methyltransferase